MPHGPPRTTLRAHATGRRSKMWQSPFFCSLYEPPTLFEEDACWWVTNTVPPATSLLAKASHHNTACEITPGTPPFSACVFAVCCSHAGQVITASDLIVSMFQENICVGLARVTGWEPYDLHDLILYIHMRAMISWDGSELFS